MCENIKHTKNMKRVKYDMCKNMKCAKYDICENIKRAKI